MRRSSPRSVAPRARMLACAFACVLAGCIGIGSDLDTAQTLYGDARYEQAAASLETLATDVPSMTPEQQTRFYYLRGMSAFRLGQRADALHYLVLARVLYDDDESRLPAGSRAVLERTLDALSPGGSAPVMFSPGRAVPSGES